MLILPKDSQSKAISEFQQERKEIQNHYNKAMERILNENGHKDKYYILGKLRFPKEFGGKIGRTFLEASDSKPMLIKDAFLYEVDNKKGCKTLLWVCYPNGTLRLPTLNKTISIDNPKKVIQA